MDVRLTVAARGERKSGKALEPEAVERSDLIPITEDAKAKIIVARGEQT